MISRLDEPVPIGPIVYFRIVFGYMAMLAWTTKAIAAGWTDVLYLEPPLHFKYPGFAWVDVWPGDAMRWHFWVLAAASLALTVGLAYRASALLVAIGFTHAFLVDRATAPESSLSDVPVVVAGRGAPRRPRVVGRRLAATRIRTTTHRLDAVATSWSCPISTVASPSWRPTGCTANPCGPRWLLEQDSVIGPYLDQPWCVWLVVYGGLLFDLLIVPALLWRKTRPVAFVLALAFHLANATLFDISVFPWLMGLLTVLFFPADLLQRLLHSKK